MSPPMNELPQLQQKILIIMRRQTCSTKRIAVSLKAEGLDCPEPLPHLRALVELEFINCETSAEEGFWSLTDKGKVAAELLWFDERFGDTAQLFRAMSGI